jgi:hypothetical protein
MNEIEKAIEHLRENPHLVYEFARQYDAVVPKRVVTFTEEARVPHYVEYKLEIPADVGQDRESVLNYIRDHTDEVKGALEEKVSNEDWSNVEWPECTGDIQVELTSVRGEKKTFDDLGRM